ncbi:hypothetical protein ABK040_007637 [Willaertia magna]
MSSIPLTNIFIEFENKLNNDEKKIILSFLDISSLCKVNCVSKSFSLSQLSNDDLFWKDHYKKIIKEYYTPLNIDFNSYFYENQQQQVMTKEIEEKINETLQLITKDYKNEIIKFIKEIIEQAKTIQKERLSKMEYNNNASLQNKESLLQKATTIMKEIKPKEYSDCKLITVGDGSVGKTCMLMVLSGHYENTKNIEYIPTVFDNWNISASFNTISDKYFISLWDTAGSE